MKLEKNEKIILIISSIIILTIILFSGKTSYEKYKYKKVEMQIEIIKDAVYSYFQDKNAYPTEQQGIEILVPFYLNKKYLKDPWGNDFIYNCPGKNNKLGFEVQRVTKL